MTTSTQSAKKLTGRKLNGSAEAILDATASLLSERRAMDVSLSDIAKRSGLNSALIKYYFGNKDGLLLAILERNAVTAMGALDHLVKMPISADKKLRIHISGIINEYARSPYLNRLIHFMIEYGQPSSSHRVEEIYVRPMVAAYRKIIEQGVQDSIFMPTDPMLLYYSLVGACDHIFHATYSVPTQLKSPELTDEFRQSYIAHVSQIFIEGLRPLGARDQPGDTSTISLPS